MQEIYEAQRNYFKENEQYLALEPWPRTVSELSPEAIPWRTKKRVPVHFDKLNWAPPGDVTGTYWVEVSEDGTSFTVFGAIDEDGDGKAAVFNFTKAKSGKWRSMRVTPEGIY